MEALRPPEVTENKNAGRHREAGDPSCAPVPRGPGSDSTWGPGPHHGGAAQEGRAGLSGHLPSLAPLDGTCGFWGEACFGAPWAPVCPRAVGDVPLSGVEQGVGETQPCAQALCLGGASLDPAARPPRPAGTSRAACRLSAVSRLGAPFLRRPPLFTALSSGLPASGPRERRVGKTEVLFPPKYVFILALHLCFQL